MVYSVDADGCDDCRLQTMVSRASRVARAQATRYAVIGSDSIGPNQFPSIIAQSAFAGGDDRNGERAETYTRWIGRWLLGEPGLSVTRQRSA